LVVKYPFEYELEPDAIDTGMHWVTVKLKNIGAETLRFLNINLNSLDSYNLSVIGTDKYVSDLKPREEEVVPFQVSANRSTSVYISLMGRKEGKYYNWESPTFTIDVGIPKAELENLYTRAVA